jgi:hypothetical protein
MINDKKTLKTSIMSNLYIDFNEKSQTLKVRQRFYTFLGIVFCVIGLLATLFDKVSLRQIISSSLNIILGLILVIQSNPHIFK